MSTCKCNQIDVGTQVFRIRNPKTHFDIVEEFESDYSQHIAARAVWRCKECGDLFAFLKIPFKDEEEIIVRVQNYNPESWDWSELADIAASVRWRGSALDDRWVL